MNNTTKILIMQIEKNTADLIIMDFILAPY